MDLTWTRLILDFIADIAASVAWPLSIVILAIVFRKPLVRLINDFKRVAFPGGSIERGDERAAELAEKVEEDASAVESGDADGEDESSQSATVPLPADSLDLTERLLEYLRVDADRVVSRAISSLGRSEAANACRTAVMESYHDMNGTVHLAGLILGRRHLDFNVSSGSRAAASVILQRLGAPDALVDSARELRRFQRQVVTRVIRVSPSGVRDYARSIEGFESQLLDWLTNRIQHSASEPTKTK